MTSWWVRRPRRCPPLAASRRPQALAMAASPPRSAAQPPWVNPARVSSSPRPGPLHDVVERDVAEDDDPHAPPAAVMESDPAAEPGTTPGDRWFSSRAGARRPGRAPAPSGDREARYGHGRGHAPTTVRHGGDPAPPRAPGHRHRGARRAGRPPLPPGARRAISGPARRGSSRPPYWSGRDSRPHGPAGTCAPSRHCGTCRACRTPAPPRPGAGR